MSEPMHSMPCLKPAERSVLFLCAEKLSKQLPALLPVYRGEAWPPAHRLTARPGRRLLRQPCRRASGRQAGCSPQAALPAGDALGHEVAQEGVVVRRPGRLQHLRANKKLVIAQDRSVDSALQTTCVPSRSMQHAALAPCESRAHACMRLPAAVRQHDT